MIGGPFRKPSNLVKPLPTLHFKKIKVAEELTKYKDFGKFWQTQRQKLGELNSAKKNEDPEIQNLQQKSQEDSFHCLKKLQSKQTTVTCETTSLIRPSILNNQYEFIDRSQILFKKQEGKEPQNIAEIVAFWKTKQCFIRIIKSNGNEIYFEQNEQQKIKGLLKIYGKLKIKFFDFLITQNYIGNTLQSVLTQFGPCSQRLIKKYLKDLVCGLSIIHSKGFAYNLLTLSNIYVTPQGNALIDVAKAKIYGKLTTEEKKNYFYFISPQFLIYEKEGTKNDTFSLGCIVLSMILGTKVNEDILLHPYNEQVIQIPKLQKSLKSKTLSILRKLVKNKKQELFKTKNVLKAQSLKDSPYKNSPVTSLNKSSKFMHSLSNKKQEPRELEISQELYNFVKQCFRFQGRPQIINLKYHPFLND